MIVNKSTAGHFYGKRPPLAEHLGPLAGTNLALTGKHVDLGAAGQTVAQVFMPGSVGAQLIGATVDKLADKAGEQIKKAYPTIGAILYFITDVIDFLMGPVGKYLDALVTGAATYLPETVANQLMDYITSNKFDLTIAAMKDTLYAQYKRLASSGSSAKDIKEGRDSVVALAFSATLKALDVGDTADRVANILYKKAIELGATEAQAGAAIGYGVINGLQARGLPANIKINTPLGPIEVKGGVGSATYVLSVPEVASTYLSKLGTPVQYTNKWIEEQFEKSQGVKRSTDDLKGSGGLGGLAIPAIALAAILLFMGKRKKREAT